MGQAFDRDGNLLGEAFGKTKREVFDKLMKEHSAAAEIRIREIERTESGASAEMPKYRCHKEVWALKILDVVDHRMGGGATIVPVDPGYVSFGVDAEFIRKHEPRAGGYYVVYKDGYKSFSPADVFEEGYTRILEKSETR